MNKTAIFIDAGHLHYHLFKEMWRINYKKLLDYFIKRSFVPLVIFYYEGMITEQSYFSHYPDSDIKEFAKAKKAKKKFFNVLRTIAFNVRTKPVHRLYDHGAGAYKFKCNFDVEIAMDIMETFFTKEIDVYLICSGDGDFTRLVNYLKNRGKKVIVAGFKANLNKKMLDAANEAIFLEAIRDKIEDL
jgi:uncharacterized LabA/DUF88 family protein